MCSSDSRKKFEEKRLQKYRYVVQILLELKAACENRDGNGLRDKRTEATRDLTLLRSWSASEQEHELLTAVRNCLVAGQDFPGLARIAQNAAKDVQNMIGLRSAYAAGRTTLRQTDESRRST